MSNNVVTISLPTDLTGSGGGFNFNYDFGGNASTIADSAYNFLNGAFANQQAFLGNSLGSSQSFLSAQIQPTVQAEAAQIQQNTQVLPSLYSGLTTFANNSLNLMGWTSQNAIQSQQTIAQASINSSTNSANQAASSGGMCFITTAVCDSLHWPDDNPILRTLRNFRDTYMSAPQRIHAIDTYYKIAPEIVRNINRRKDAKQVYLKMLRFFLVPACAAIKKGDNDIAFIIYEALVIYAREKAKNHGNG